MNGNGGALETPSGLFAVPAENLVKSRQRVIDHGEVFTPAWLVDAMLDLVKDESERIDARFLEPACGSGNFLVPVLARKLAAVQQKYGTNDFERRHYALLGLMCTYGIELLDDNAEECRGNLLELFAGYLKISSEDDVFVAAQRVLAVNIIRGDALSMTTAEDEAFTFPEWGYLGKGKFQRRDFRYDTLTQMSSLGEDTLFGDLGGHEVFAPVRIYPPLTISEIANG